MSKFLVGNGEKSDGDDIFLGGESIFLLLGFTHVINSCYVAHYDFLRANIVVVLRSEFFRTCIQDYRMNRVIMLLRRV